MYSADYAHYTEAGYLIGPKSKLFFGGNIFYCNGKSTLTLCHLRAQELNVVKNKQIIETEDRKSALDRENYNIYRGGMVFKDEKKKTVKVQKAFLLASELLSATMEKMAFSYHKHG